MTWSSRTRASALACAATLLAALTLHPVLDGWAWYGSVVVLAVLVPAVGTVTRQAWRSWPVVAAVQAGAVAVALTVMFARDFAVWGFLPGPAALDRFRVLLEEGTRITRDQAPPVDSDRGVVLLVALGMAGVAVLVDVLAAGLRKPAATGLPLLAVYCVPAAVVPGGLGWFWFVLAAVGYLALVGADSGDRLRSWGRALGGERDESVGAAVARSGPGVRTAALSVVLAAVLPALVPGLSDPILTGNGLGGGDGEGRAGRYVNPILDLRRDLTKRSNEVALTYRTDDPSPQPLRLVVDQVFDGRTWSPGRLDLSPEDRVERGIIGPQGLDPELVESTARRVDVAIGGLTQDYLPVPYPPTRITAPGNWLYDTSTLNVVGRGTRTTNLQYSVEYLSLKPTDAQLAGAPEPPIIVTSANTQLPRLPDSVRRTAQQVGGTGSDYERAVRLQEWFRSKGNFTYSTEAPGRGPDDGGLDAIEAFLRERRGYCVHFASAMTVMARTLGIPARVAVGFLPGQPDGQGRYTVTFAKAHAWPELFFAGVGWVRFEPTPATQSGLAPAWTLPQSGSVDGRTDAGQELPIPNRPRNDGGSDDPQAQDPGSSTADGGRSLDVPWRVVGSVAAVLLMLVAPRIVATVRRRRRWGRARAQGWSAEAAWDELAERLRDLGHGWPVSATPRGAAQRLREVLALRPQEQEGLSRLVAVLESARYAPPEAAVRRGGDAALREDVAGVVAAAARGAGRRRRWRAMWFPTAAWRLRTGAGPRDDVAGPRLLSRSGT